MELLQQRANAAGTSIVYFLKGIKNFLDSDKNANVDALAMDVFIKRCIFLPRWIIQYWPILRWVLP